jgi:fumarate hydratase class II
MIEFRTERDSFGDIDVPAERLWGAQIQRSLDHFAISTERMPLELINALAQVKRAAALVNRDFGLLDFSVAETIIEAADEVLTGKYDEEFPLSVWQTGSGTQSNMNMNEVLANRASELLGVVASARCIRTIMEIWGNRPMMCSLQQCTSRHRSHLIEK